MIRLFIALKIPDEIKKQITTLRSSIYTAPLPLKWEPEDKLHLTLKFIGEVPENLVPEITDSISFIESYKKFHCSFTGFGFFYNKQQPKILWAGFWVEKSLIELADKLNKHFVQFSIPAETRKFKAHITLMRIKELKDKKFTEAFENFRTTEVPFIADEVALIKSELLPSGSRYTDIKNFELK